MDSVEFRIEQHENYGEVVEILVNSVSLARLAEDFELPRYKLESAYAGLPTSCLGAASHHFLGDAEPYFLHDGRVQLLGCCCGEFACWPLACRMDVGPDVVTWSDFLQPFRVKDSAGGYWSYEGFGPFQFDRRQYDRALEALCHQRHGG